MATHSGEVKNNLDQPHSQDSSSAAQEKQHKDFALTFDQAMIHIEVLLNIGKTPSDTLDTLQELTPAHRLDIRECCDPTQMTTDQKQELDDFLECKVTDGEGKVTDEVKYRTLFEATILNESTVNKAATPLSDATTSGITTNGAITSSTTTSAPNPPITHQLQLHQHAAKQEDERAKQEAETRRIEEAKAAKVAADALAATIAAEAHAKKCAAIHALADKLGM